MGITTFTLLGAAFVIGTLLSSSSNDTLNEGPRLADLQVQHATFGTPMSKIYGTYRVGGNIIWALPIEEFVHDVITDTGGKGGGGDSYTDRTFTYTGTWATGLTQGPIIGVKKIWFDSVIVFDGENYDGGLSDSNYVIYNGTNTQQPDWTIQSDKPDTPAYRNLCYIVFKDIELRLYGNRVPNVSVEVVQNGYIEIEETSSNILLNDISVTSPVPINGLVNGYTSAYDAEYGGRLIKLYHVFEDTETAVATKNLENKIELNVYDVNGMYCVYDTTDAYEILYKYELLNGTSTYNSEGELIKEYLSYTFHGNIDSSTYTHTKDNIALAYYASTSKVVKMFESSYMGSSYSYTNSDLGSTLVEDITFIDMCLGINEFYMFYKLEDKIAVFDLNGVFIKDILSPIFLPHTPNTPLTDSYMKFDIASNLLYVYIWNIDSKPEVYVSLDDVLIPHHSVVDAFNITDPSIQSSFGILNGVTYTADDYISTYRPILNSTEIDLNTIYTEILGLTTLKESDYIIETNSETIFGYAIPSPTSSRSMLDVLLDVFLYDIIEYDYKLHITTYTAKNSLVNIPEDDIYGTFIIARKNISDLSSTINVQYSNKDRLYESAIQSAKRIDSSSVKITNKQHAIAISDDNAKQLADIALYLEWTNIDTFEFYLSSSYYYLNPSDIINITSNKLTYTVRILKITYNSNLTISIEAELYNNSVYVSEAVGSNTSSQLPTTINPKEPTYFVLLDMPLLVNEIDTINIQIAATGYTNNWSGAYIYVKSQANIFKKLNQITDYTVLGVSNSVLGSNIPTVLDTTNNVIVSLIYGSLYSISFTELLNAGNYILLGNEILQYQTAVDNGNGTYTLSNLLRGRRGTEWAIHTHEIGETFVLLDINIIVNTDVILNVESNYIAKTLDSALESPLKSIYPQAISMKPFSVSNIYGIRDESGNLTISWLRRSREVSGYFRTLNLFETSEQYSIAILSGIGRTLTSNVESIIYTAEQQIADGISLNSPITLNIYQISDVVNKGYKAEGII